ncbi:hypothetical protein NUH86_10905 [Sphingobium sp. JS3065]|uniref:hypothetical protein n=1 Tax=Sphingobium sp. JS3065 TaxID=2970925 RepID=UPI00226478E0|nr:hypothetical protein [Sphingobium sp. JS3065]UZW54044.1 hypothetical protein NUH86_10905 [Sphingobium sp. JS3065]
MADKPKFEVVNRLGEVFEGASPAEARSAMIAAARQALIEDAARDPDRVTALNARLARMDAARKRERQRIDHLVLGLPRPIERVTEGKRKGRSKPKLIERPVRLEPGIEEAVQVRESWNHKAYGTPETWDRSTRTHDGSLVQLHRNGTIDKDQLEWAAQIANVYRSLEADVAVKVASLEARVDQSRRTGGMAAESVYRVRMHLAYGYWRDMLPLPRQMVLDMIVGDTIGYSVAAHRYRVHKRKAKRFLLDALNRWPMCVAHAFSMVDRHTVDALNAGQKVIPGWLGGPARRHSAATDQDTVDALEIAEEQVTRCHLYDIDPEFLDERGLLKEWKDIADIIRARLGAVEEEAA